jgi:hypothetical protein
MENRQKNVRVAKDALSKLLLHLQELIANIASKKLNGILYETTMRMQLHLPRVCP